MGRLQDETLNGTKWQLIRSFTMKPVGFIAGMILARLISPDEMGTFALIGIYFDIAVQLYSCGFGTALIRKQDRTEEDCSTVFWYNMVVCGVCMLALGIASPWLADFYGIPDLCPLTIIAAINMFLSASCGVHNALYSARRDFRTPAIIGICVGSFTLLVTVIFAFMGYGYWSYSIAGTVGTLVTLITIWIVSPWKPRFVFSWKSFKEFFGFGVRLSATTLVTNLYDGSRQFIIGKYHSPAQLAYFDRAFGLSSMPLGYVNGLWKSVALPILSTVQDDIPRLIRAYRIYIRVASLIILWGMITLCAAAPSILYCVYGERWLPCIPYMRVLCLGIMFNPLTFINENIYLVRGRTDVLLRREIIFRVFGVAVLIIGAFFGVMGICVAAAASGMFCCMVSLFVTRTILPLPVHAQLMDFLPHLVLAILVNIPIYFLNELSLCAYVVAPVSILASGGVYSFILWLKKDEAFLKLLEIAKEKTARFRAKRA